MRKIVQHLFSKHDDLPQLQTGRNLGSIPPVTEEEIIEAGLKMKTGKSPGLDGIPDVIIKEGMLQNPGFFAGIYSSCLNEAVFPKKWKRQRLVLIPKEGKPPEEPSSYRPLCMLDVMGKVLERIICSRLEETTEANISNEQYGFRKKRSTGLAVSRVCEIAKRAIDGQRWKGGSKEYCAIITLDVRNAFNSASWKMILNALKRMNTPLYLVQMVESYLSERTLIYDTSDGSIPYHLTAGIPQGSVLGPLLWNVMYDGILNITRPNNVHIIGYADDIAIVAVAKHKQELSDLCTATIEKAQVWLQQAALELAEQKTEVLLVSSRKKVEKLQVKVGLHYIQSSEHIRYLGVILDHRMCFKEHLKHAGEKATKVARALSRLMPNQGGPRQKIRKLLAEVGRSIIMYACHIWAENTKYPTYMRNIVRADRLMDLRIACAFRTVSYEAICLIAGQIPVDLSATETALMRTMTTNDERANVRKETLEKWQQRWCRSPKGRWTHKIIPYIQPWVNRRHGELNHHLTQWLSGHGCFREYLYKYKHVEDPRCQFCDNAVENAEHVLLECRRFTSARTALQMQINESISAAGIVRHMLKPTEA